MDLSSCIVSDVKKIAILRSGALGDFIVTLPAIKSIRLAYPEAEIILLGKPWMKDLLNNKRTPVDRFIPIPIYQGIREEQEKFQNEEECKLFFEEMKSEQFDIALQFQGKGISANPFIKKLEARLTVGMVSSLEAELLDRSIEYYYYQSEPIRYLEIAQLIGGKPVEPEPEIRVLKEDLTEAQEFLSAHVDEPYIVLHPFAMDIRRSWPPENFAATGDKLFQLGFSIIFSGSKQDEKFVADIIKKMTNPAINACGKLSLGGLSGLLKKSALVISSDTGPLHLARAAGAKTVGIYWAPNLINWGPLARNNHRPIISWDLNCPICGILPNDPFPFEPLRETCSHNVSFVRKVKVIDVMKEAEILLGQKKLAIDGIRKEMAK